MTPGVDFTKRTSSSRYYKLKANTQDKTIVITICEIPRICTQMVGEYLMAGCYKLYLSRLEGKSSPSFEIGHVLE